jgi:hopene-associated glycosyltransferase HpnB
MMVINTYESMLSIIAGLISLLIWAYLLFARGGFWQANRVTASPLVSSKPQSLVAVIVPARNEADVVGQSIFSLLNQSYNDALHIFLVDDGSTDSTAQIAREAAAQSGKATGLTVIEGLPLPPGWSGKLWALNQGVEKARELNPSFLLFTDADVVHAPESISTLISIAEAGRYDLASFMVKLHCATLAEKLLVPAFVFFFLKLYPPRWIADPRRSTAGAAGGCILVRPQALDRAGGIAAIRDQIIDDCALARKVKRSGGSLWMGLTGMARSIRPYKTFGEIGRMISRTAFNQLDHSALMLFLSLLGLTFTYLLPPLLLLAHSTLARELGAGAWITMMLSYLSMVRFYSLSPAWVFVLPVVAVFYMSATIHSAVKFWLGQGGEWKGRMQDPPKA